MTDLVHMQDAFTNGLTGDLPMAPAFLKAAHGSVDHRYNIYRNNVFAGLTGVLEARFPAVCRIVGEEFFRGFARQFIVEHPPQSPALVFYGGTFPAYIRASEHCEDVPYLGDVAQIEWELHRCTHAADDVILTAEDLARIASSPEATVLRLAASTAVVSSQYPAFSIWRANASAQSTGSLRVEARSEITLITRRDLRCEAFLMPPGGAVFAQSLASGGTLAEAAHAAASADPAFRLDQVLGMMLRSHAFARPSRQPVQEPRP